MAWRAKFALLREAAEWSMEMLERLLEAIPKDHPIWGFAWIVCIAVVLSQNASNFDITEYKSIGEIGLVGAGLEFLRRRSG